MEKINAYENKGDSEEIKYGDFNAETVYENAAEQQESVNVGDSDAKIIMNRKKKAVLTSAIVTAGVNAIPVITDIFEHRKDPTPYHVWVSEIMLQQTRVEAVKPFYARFMEALPDVQALAECETDRLLKLWEGLGYYNRVRNLQTAAQTIMSDYGGVLPADYEELLKLKGIGHYTAAAIASSASGAHHA